MNRSFRLAKAAVLGAIQAFALTFLLCLIFALIGSLTQQSFYLPGFFESLIVKNQNPNDLFSITTRVYMFGPCIVALLGAILGLINALRKEKKVALDVKDSTKKLEN